MDYIEHNGRKYWLYVSDWMQKVNSDHEFMNIVMPVVIVAKNGRRFVAQFASHSVISRRELVQARYINEIKKQKKEYNIESIRKELNSLTYRRMGFPGMRGYFKPVEVLPYEMG